MPSKTTIKFGEEEKSFFMHEPQVMPDGTKAVFGFNPDTEENYVANYSKDGVLLNERCFLLKEGYN